MFLASPFERLGLYRASECLSREREIDRMFENNSSRVQGELINTELKSGAFWTETLRIIRPLNYCRCCTYCFRCFRIAVVAIRDDTRFKLSFLRNSKLFESISNIVALYKLNLTMDATFYCQCGHRRWICTHRWNSFLFLLNIFVERSFESSMKICHSVNDF